jgi:hypothetical protein
LIEKNIGTHRSRTQNLNQTSNREFKRLKEDCCFLRERERERESFSFEIECEVLERLDFHTARKTTDN